MPTSSGGDGTRSRSGVNAATTETGFGVRGGTPVLTGLIFSGMGAGTFTIVSLGILASFIIDDLDISRAQLGLVIGADTLFAAAFSPYAGRIADRLGGRRSLMALFLVAALAWIVYSAAPVYGLMFAGAMLGGMADASCNPATNRMIVERLATGSRGVVTGIKQSGVQAGVFVGGVTLPSMAVAFGWRTTYVIVAALPILLAIATAWLVEPPRHEVASSRVEFAGRLPASIWWLGAYGVLFGFAGAAALLVPLFVEEGLGQDARLGGLVAGAIGFVAVGARIWWARLSERIGRFVEPLWAMTPLGVAGAVAFLFSDEIGLWLVWPAAVMLGMSTSSWNGVAMLAAMDEAGAAATGRASGVIVSGFLLGLGLGPPVYGALVDRSGGSYDPMWSVSAVAALATGILVAVWQVRRHRDGAGSATP